jgi:hypothetical protein
LAAEVDDVDGKPTWPFFMRGSTGRLEIALGNLTNVPAFKSDEARHKLLNRVRALPTPHVRATDSLKGWPSIPLEDILQDDVWQAWRSLALDVKAAIKS